MIRLKQSPTDVADMNIRNHELPLRPGNLGRAVLAVWQKTGADATIDECAGIARVMQHLEDSRVRRPHPMQLALVQSLANAAGEPETLLAEQLRGLHRRSGPVEGLEDQAHRSLYFRVWIENQNAVVPINQTDGRPHLKLATSSFVDHSASHSRLEEMKFRFGQSPF